MGEIIFIIGGTRSGKSAFAVQMANKIGKNKVTFIATCFAKDEEMTKRIEMHKKNRPASWETIEINPKSQTCLPDRQVPNPKKNQISKSQSKKIKNQHIFWLIEQSKKIRSDCKVALIDCLTLLVSNLFMVGLKEEEIKKEVEKLAMLLLKAPYTSIIVSNELGLGIVPENKFARKFRDIAGISNQIIARFAKEVHFVAAGIPIKIKGDKTYG